MTGPRDDRGPATTAETFDGFSWEYDPADEAKALLLPAGRFFEEIPWDLEDEDVE